jgi:epoxide hydrolase 4
MFTRALLVLLFVSLTAVSVQAADFESKVKQGFVDSNGVKIHYATMGSGPLIVMIHGFPDYWYTWRKQMEGLADKYQCVAIDQRGYNLSDKPDGVDNYAMPLLVGDVIAVIKHFGKDNPRAIVVGHDWGGAVAWQLALNAPQFVDRLIILNLPHPRGITRELAHNPKQQAASAYARNFQKDGAETMIKPEQLTFWVTDPEAKQKYIEAFQLRHQGHAELLQTQLSARALPGRYFAGGEDADAGAHDPRAQGHSAALRCAE